MTYSEKRSNYSLLKTVCPRDCYDTCFLNVLTDTSRQRIISIEPDSTNPITGNFLCPRGIKDLERLYTNRIARPLFKKQLLYSDISWNESLTLISRKIKETVKNYGESSILSLYFAGNQGLLSTTFPQRLWYAIGASQTDCTLCTSSGHSALKLHYGETYGLQPLELLKQKLIVFWGFNAAVSAPHIWSLARQAQKDNNAKIIVIDPIKTQTAKKADIWIQLFPGQDIFLAYCIINMIIRNNLADSSFIQKWTHGYENLQQKVKNYTVDNVIRHTGIQKNAIELLYESYSSLKPGATMIGIGLQKSENGADNVRTISFIPTLLGYHRNFFFSNSQAFNFDNSYLSGVSITNKKINIVNQVSLANMVSEGKFKFIYINCMNPAETLPKSNGFIRGIKRNDVFTVVHDTHWSETAKSADLVLPAPTYLEKNDLIIPWTHNFVRFSKKMIDPVTDSRTEIFVMNKIAEKLQLNQQWLYENPYIALRKSFANSFQNGNFKQLISGKTLKLKLKPKDSYQTPSGKVDLTLPETDNLGKVEIISITDSNSFILISSSTAKYTSTQFQDIYGKIPCIVKMNDKDALKLSINDSETVLLSNSNGSIKLKAIISKDLIQGILWVPRQGKDLDGFPVNSIMTNQPQAIGNGSAFNSTKVSLYKPDRS